GGHLAAAGHRVTLVGRPPLMNKIASAGLTIRWPDAAPQTTTPESVTGLDGLSPAYDFILITVKATSTAAAVEQLQGYPVLLESPYLVSLQNGVGNEEALAEAFGAEKVIAGTITIPIQVPGLGVIEVSKAKGGLGLAPLTDAHSEPVSRLANALTEAGLVTPTYRDYRAMKWSKLLLNIVNNATSAILDLAPAQIVANPDLFDLEIAALREGLAVMRADGIPAVKLPGYPVHWLARLLRLRWLPQPVVRAALRPAMVSGRGSKMPSLHIDLAGGRQASEVGVLNGAIVQAGARLKIPTPVNHTLTTILDGMFTGTVPRSDYQHQPKKLLAAVNQHRKSPAF
ncbi:MAG: 2-dehydropantoate 2-reductase, partial [Anaerolineae bacterium]|nr:2-dehydropantoate 2-reductase [Anaerolineae bacterium]